MVQAQVALPLRPVLYFLLPLLFFVVLFPLHGEFVVDPLQVSPPVQRVARRASSGDRRLLLLGGCVGRAAHATLTPVPHVAPSLLAASCRFDLCTPTDTFCLDTYQNPD